MSTPTRDMSDRVVRTLIIRVESACSQAKRARKSRKFSATLSFEREAKRLPSAPHHGDLGSSHRLDAKMQLIVEPESIVGANSTTPGTQGCLLFRFFPRIDREISADNDATRLSSTSSGGCTRIYEYVCVCIHSVAPAAATAGSRFGQQKRVIT